MLNLFLITLLPLVLFVIIDVYSGPRHAILAAIVTSILGLGVVWWMMGTLDELGVGAVVLLGILGWISVKSKNTVYFKFQPSIFAFVLVGVCLYFQFFDTPITVKFLPQVRNLLPPEQGELLGEPEVIRRMGQMVWPLMASYALHGFAMAYAALRLSNWWWLAFRAVGFWVFFVVTVSATMAIWAI